MIAIGNFRYLQTGALSFLTITCKMKSQKHASRFDLRYDIYSGLWCHKPMKELGFECDFVKLSRLSNCPTDGDHLTMPGGSSQRKRWRCAIPSPSLHQLIRRPVARSGSTRWASPSCGE